MDCYSETFETGWQTMMAHKLGLQAFNPSTDNDLCAELLIIMQLVETDMTLFYRQLAKIDCSQGLEETQIDSAVDRLSPAYYVPEQITPTYQLRLKQWLKTYGQRIQSDQRSHSERLNQMNAVNPLYVLRNYLAQLAIDKAEQFDFAGVHELLDVLRHPYTEQDGKAHYSAKRPDWARQRAGCSMLSCSS